MAQGGANDQVQDRRHGNRCDHRGSGSCCFGPREQRRDRVSEHAKGVVYKTEDRSDNKQVREFFTSREAVRAAREGAPLPSGTVITVVRYAAQLDAEGNPAKDANGRFIKTNNILGYSVREKRAGWGAEYPEGKRNGEWEYRVLRADRTANPDTNYDNCFGCHKSQESQEYMFTFDSLKVALR